MASDVNELIDRASAVLRPHRTQTGRLIGDVGAALICASGKVHVGVCVDTPSWGLCAERSAIAAMVTNGEYRIEQIVAVWRDEASGALHVLPPCGVCREFMRQIDDTNLDTRVVLGRNSTRLLRELLPEYGWPLPLD